MMPDSQRPVASADTTALIEEARRHVENSAVKHRISGDLLTSLADALEAEKARADALRGEREPASVWSLAEWEDWSNEIALLLPDDYDGDESQEFLISRAVASLAEKTAAYDALREGVQALTDDDNDAIYDQIETALDKSHGGSHYDCCCFSVTHFAEASASAVKAILRSLLGDSQKDNSGNENSGGTP